MSTIEQNVSRTLRRQPASLRLLTQRSSLIVPEIQTDLQNKPVKRKQKLMQKAMIDGIKMKIANE